MAAAGRIILPGANGSGHMWPSDSGDKRGLCSGTQHAWVRVMSSDAIHAIGRSARPRLLVVLLSLGVGACSGASHEEEGDSAAEALESRGARAYPAAAAIARSYILAPAVNPYTGTFSWEDTCIGFAHWMSTLVTGKGLCRSSTPDSPPDSEGARTSRGYGERRRLVARDEACGPSAYRPQPHSRRRRRVLRRSWTECRSNAGTRRDLLWLQHRDGGPVRDHDGGLSHRPVRDDISSIKEVPLVQLNQEMGSVLLGWATFE